MFEHTASAHSTGYQLVAQTMRILCVNDALVAAVAATAAVRAAAFLCPPTAQIGAIQHQSRIRPAASTIRNGQARHGEQQHQRRSPSPPRAYCSLGSRTAAWRTELSASAEGSSPGEGGEGVPGVPTLPGMKTVVETEEEEEQRAAREWQDDGRKGRVLVRRKEIPAPDKDPAAVCQLIFQSLQNNDDPMLDYGAAVAVKFASSKSAIKDMTPAEYGDFLRNDSEYVLLIDNATCRPAERAKVSADGAQVLQKVELIGVYPDDAKRIVEVQLSKEDDCWRVDALYFVPAA